MDDAAFSTPVCVTCGAETPEDARFCPRCGTRVEAGEALAFDDEPAAAQPATFSQAERRIFGLAPPELVFGLVLVVLALGVYFLVAGPWVIGVVLLVLSLGIGWIFLATARSLPEGRLAHTAVGVSDGARNRAGLAWVSVASWSHAGREAVRLRSLEYRLRREQGELIRALG